MLGSELTNYSTLRLKYQRKAYGFNQAGPAYMDVVLIININAGLDSSGLRKFIYLGDFI